MRLNLCIVCAVQETISSINASSATRTDAVSIQRKALNPCLRRDVHLNPQYISDIRNEIIWVKYVILLMEMRKLVESEFLIMRKHMLKSSNCDLKVTIRSVIT